MNEKTTKVIKLSNGEDIVCTCMESHNTENDKILNVSQPLKMQIRNRVTKKGVVEALTLSRWLQPFTEDENYKLERSNIVTISDASYALNNYYKFMLEAIDKTEEVGPPEDEIKMRARFDNTISPDEYDTANEQVQEMFNEYVKQVRESKQEKPKIRMEELSEEEEIISEEELDIMPCSDTKH